MPSQSKQEQVVNTFVKGLVTEAGEMTFPENASVDELNCDLRRDGTRRRRLGIETETNATDSTFTITDNEKVGTGTWRNVGGQQGLNYLVVQEGNTLQFYNKGSAPFSGSQIATSVDLSAYEHTTSLGAGNDLCSYASVDGALVVANPQINTIYCEYAVDTGTMTITEIDFRVRDFSWQGDKSAYAEEGVSGSVSDERKYDTANVGWIGTKGAAALTTYTGANSGNYPALTLSWFAGKDSNSNFSESEWQKIFAGTTLIANGHFILDFFNKDRATASGLSITLATEKENSRFSTVEALGNRIFYSGLNSAKNGSKILFTRVLQDLSEIGDCYQRGDPTSEDFPDLVDDDGGVISIEGIDGIKKLFAMGSSLMVFADNGVWQVDGVDGVFTPSQYAVRKVSEVGILTDQSFVSADGTPFWWSEEGIHSIEVDKVSFQATEVNISISTIQSFFDSISGDSKLAVRSAFDAANKRIYWSYPNDNETSSNKLNKFLVLDLPLQAFYPWTVSDQETNTDSIVGVEYYPGFGKESATLDVVTSAGDDVLTSAGDDVVSTQSSLFGTGSPSIILLVRRGDNNAMTMGLFTSATFLDWGLADYSSYAETPYNFLGSPLAKKTAPYVKVFMRVTEDGFVEEGEGYTPTNPSSLFVKAFWDYSNTSSTTPQQCYRLKHTPVVDPTDLNTFGYPTTVTDSKIKLRGKGTSMRLRFDSETGKDFILIGWSILGAVNRGY